MHAQPTPYADVNEVLDQFLADISALLGPRFVGMYVYGSLALGDFDPRGSDIDFVVVTDSDLSVDLVEALHAMHDRFNAGDSPWTTEGAVVSKPVAARWVEKTSARHWAALIERSLIWRKARQDVPSSDELDDTVALIQYTIERCRDFLIATATQ
jgi:hypothetical protein